MNHLRPSHPRLTHLPRWMPYVYGLVAIGLIPWIGWLSYVLPTRHLVTHWDAAWVGFDIVLLISMAQTAILAFMRSSWVIIAATATGTLLVADAWFDMLTARVGIQSTVAVISAIGLELPLAVLSFWVAYRTTRRLLRDSKA